MTVEVRPMGTSCNMDCTYCYQESVRQAKNFKPIYSIEKILDKLKEVNQDFHLFGGEAFLVPREDRIKLWEYGLKQFDKNAVQTNGTLITDQDIEDMLTYKVSVGVSIDGPNDLNDLRQVRKYKAKSAEKIAATRETTQTIMDNIRKMKAAGVSVGIIITLHQLNGSKEQLPRLLNFIDWLSENGVKGGSIHTLEVDPTMPDQDIHVLTQEETIYAMKEMIKFFEERPELSYNPFADFKKIITEDDDRDTTCFLHFCDPLNTQAVYGIEGDGSLSNCGRTDKDGVNWHKTPNTSYLRYISLYNTPQENGGCKDCRFWLYCSGNCPGEAINGDFRNRSTNCETYKALFSEYEETALKDGKTPLTLSPQLWEVEQIMLKDLALGKQSTVQNILKYLEENPTIVVVPVKEKK